jgi:hypothetical protein
MIFLFPSHAEPAFLFPIGVTTTHYVSDHYLRDLHHHRTGQDDVVGQDTVKWRGAGEVDIGNAAETLGNDAGAVGKVAESGTAGEAASGEGAAGGLGRGIGLELDRGTSLEGGGVLTSGHGQGGEGSQDKVASLGAAGDEGRSEREDLLGRQGRVERLRHGNDLAGGADERLVASLNRENSGGGGENAGVGNEGAGAEVGGHADVLEDGSGANHAEGIGEAEVVLARLHGLDTSLSNSTLQENDVGLFRLANVCQVVDLLLCKAESGELLCGELGETLSVELGLEVLEGEGAGSS